MKDKIDFQVYNFLLHIPKGKVTTYGKIGRELGINPRQVGRILHNNPDPKKYPCHRVVFSDGKLTDGYAFGGIGKQNELLLAEGVTFNGDKVSGVSFV